MKKEVIRVLSSLIIAIFLVFVCISISEVFGLELVQDYTADAGPFTGEKYFSDMVAHSAYWCDGHGKPFFHKRQTEITLEGDVNGTAFSANVTDGGDFSIWSVSHGSCSGSSYNLTLKSVSFSGMNSATIRGRCNPLTATGTGAVVRATGKTNFVLEYSKDVKNDYEAYIIAEANANLPGVEPKNSQPNIAWWNKDQASNYSPSSSYSPTKTSDGTDFEDSSAPSIGQQISDAEKQLSDYVDYLDKEIQHAKDTLKAYEDLKADLTGKNSGATTRIAQLEAENTILTSEIAALDAEISTLDTEITNLTTNISTCDTQLATLNAEKATLVEQKNNLTTDAEKAAKQVEIDAKQAQIDAKNTERTGYVNSKTSKEATRNSKQSLRNTKQAKYNANIIEINENRRDITDIKAAENGVGLTMEDLIANVEESIKTMKAYIKQLEEMRKNANDVKNDPNNPSLESLKKLQEILKEVSDTVIGDEEGYSSSDAEGILKEAAIFNAMHNGSDGINGNYKGTIEDKTIQKDVKVDYDATAQQYIVGPFNIKYMEAYAKENQFAGITGTPQLKLNINGSEVVKPLGAGWSFGWKDARKTVGTLGDEVPEKFDVYPHTEEDFYLVINYEDGLNKITGFHLDFRYLTAEGKYERYSGTVEIWKWQVGTPEFTTCNEYLGMHHEDEPNDPLIGGTHCTDGCHAEYCDKYKAAKVSVSKSKDGEAEIQPCMRVAWAKRGYEPEEIDLVWDIDLTTTLAGDVWLDIEAQKANLFSASGVWEGGERGLDNIAVTVYLYQGTTKIRPALFHDPSGAPLTWPLYTAGGHYEVNRLEAPGGAANCFYVVEFEYDGQVLKSTVYMSTGGGEGSAGAYSSSPDAYSKSSMAVEEVIDRAKLDASFGEITGDSPISGGNTSGITHTTGLDGNGAGGSGSLEYSGGSNGNFIESKLQSPFRSNSVSRGTRYNLIASTYYNDTDTLGVSVSKDKFRIKYPLEGSYYTLNKFDNGTQRYIAEYMLHINLGLIERTETDISVLKDLYKVTVVVNEQKMTKEFNPYGTTSGYEQFLIQLEQTRVDGGYTLGLYSSDVGYQSYQRYCNAIKAVQDIKNGTELKVYATYIIRVYNNSDTMDVEVNEITDYFDNTFTLIDQDKYTSIVNEDTKRHNTLVAEAPYYRICNVYSSNPWKPTRTENFDGLSSTVNGYTATGNLNWDNIGSAGGGLQSSKSTSLTNIKLDNTEYAEIFTTYEIDRNGYFNMTGSGNAGSCSITTRNALMGDKYNIAELSNYSTYYSEKDVRGGYYTPYIEGRVSGRVDRDSAPNNIDRGNPKNMSSYEDDTFNANVLKVQIMNFEREMYGYVWEDKKTEDVGSYELKVGNGYKDSGENLVPNVEVSLYEVINLGQLNANGYYNATYDGLEYYYKVPNQFYNLPKTGSTGINGNPDITMTSASEVNDIDGHRVNGNYYLYGFLAGDYVTRFDYGKHADSRETIYTDVGISTEEDVIKYNGQDYENTRFLAELTAGDALNDKYLDLTKSTTIAVNGANRDINDLNISKARDNESRRMVVNSYSRNIENDRGEILRDRLSSNTEYVEATQMFAETPIMSIEVNDPQTMRKSQTPHTQKRPNGNAPYNEKTDPIENQILSYRYTIKNINLGLEKRAETDIRLEKYIDTIMLTKADEIIFSAHMNEDGEVITEHSGSKSLDKLTYISHTRAGLTQQGFYAIAVEDDYMNDLSLLIKYKMKVINSSEVDFTGRLNDYYLSEKIVKAANGSPTVDLYKMALDNIKLEELDGVGLSTNTTLAEILSWNPDNEQLANLLRLDDLTINGSIDQTDTLRPEVIVYGRYVGRFYYENRIGNERAYTIKNYVKNVNLADINVTYTEDKVVRTTVDQLIDYIDVNTSLDEVESEIGIEDTSWSLANTDVEVDGTITSLRNIVSDSTYRLPATVSGADVIKSIYDEKDRKLIRDSTSNIAISYNERLERGSDNRMKYIDDVANRVQSMFNSSMTIELKPEKYNPNESTGIVYIVTRKNTSSGQDANEMKMDNLAEILVYSIPTGRRDINSVPGNAMVIAKNNGFWKAGYNSIATYPESDHNNWTVCPENDAWSPEYVTIIAPTGIGMLTLIRNNVMQMAGLIIILLGFITIFGVKQVKIRNNRDD